MIKKEIKLSSSEAVLCANCFYAITDTHPFCACHEFVRRIKAKKNTKAYKDWRKFMEGVERAREKE